MCTKISDNIITFNVCGVPVKLSTETLAKHPDSLLTTMVHNKVQPAEGWFVECCPKLFGHVLRFLVHDIKVDPVVVAGKLGISEGAVRKVIDGFKLKGIYVSATKDTDQEVHEAKKVIDELYKDIWGHASHGEIEKLRSLRDQGYDLDVKRYQDCGDWGSTPLMFAAQNGQLDCVEFLIESGVDVKAKNKIGMEVLHFAIERNMPNMIEYLFEKGANINAIDDSGNTPLLRAIARDHVGSFIIKLLLQLGADPNMKNNKGENALGCAIDRCEPYFIKELVTEKTNLDEKIASGQIPLHLAVRSELCEACDTVECLLKLGASPYVPDDDGNIPLMVAIKMNHQVMAKILCKHMYKREK
jgi:hypothetical protein